MLEKINSPQDLKKLSVRQIEELAAEIRPLLVETVLRQGGHLASNLGAVELTLALDYVFDVPQDKIVFDVGHQSYVHKILTGRREAFAHLRERGGLSGFPRISESEYDAFPAGHASTAISAALGMARARDLMGDSYAVVAVLGDGALTGGMCYEALNDAGSSHTPLIIVLNDNEMSISRNVGALSAHLTKMRQGVIYGRARRAVKRGLGRLPGIGQPMLRGVTKAVGSIKRLVLGEHFFEALGVRYLGPIDGHNLKDLIPVFRRAAASDEPVLIHVVTQKGRGFEEAEEQPERYHSVPPKRAGNAEQTISNGRIAVSELIELAQKDIRVTALAAAMPAGTCLSDFERRFPDRFFDAGIAEEHMVTMAAGMAAAGLRPYVGVYSTFLQRAYDQLIHDVCLEELPVTLLIDRSGLVGQDGATHQGVFDLSYLRQMPNMVVASPRDVRQLKRLIRLSATYDGPMAIRYAREGDDMGPNLHDREPLRLGSWEELIGGDDVEILAVGRMVGVALNASVELAQRGVSCGVVDARFVKPLDEDMLRASAQRHKLIVTLEDNVIAGGFGSAVNEKLAAWGVRANVLNLGVPDRFIEHATVAEQMEACGLSPAAVAEAVETRFNVVKNDVYLTKI